MGWHPDQPIHQQWLQLNLSQAWMACQTRWIVKSVGLSTTGSLTEGADSSPLFFNSIARFGYSATAWIFRRRLSGRATSIPSMTISNVIETGGAMLWIYRYIPLFPLLLSIVSITFLISLSNDGNIENMFRTHRTCSNILGNYLFRQVTSKALCSA